MFSKSEEKKGGDSFMTGGGYPYERPERGPIAKTQKERQSPTLINLDELDKPGGPRHFSKEAGRVLPSFIEKKDLKDVVDEDDYDIE